MDSQDFWNSWWVNTIAGLIILGGSVLITIWLVTGWDIEEEGRMKRLNSQLSYEQRVYIIERGNGR